MVRVFNEHPFLRMSTHQVVDERVYQQYKWKSLKQMINITLTYVHMAQRE